MCVCLSTFCPLRLPYVSQVPGARHRGRVTHVHADITQQHDGRCTQKRTNKGSSLKQSERKFRVRVNWGGKDECWMNLVKVSSRLKLFSHCLTCFCKYTFQYSRWRHIRKLLIHSHREEETSCIISWATFVYVYCTRWTVESTLLPFLLQQRPSHRLPTSTCSGLNLRVEYFHSSPLPCLGRCTSTPPADRTQAHPNCAQDQLFKRV